MPAAPYAIGPHPLVSNVDAVLHDMRRERPELCNWIRPGFDLAAIFSPDTLDRCDEVFLDYVATKIAMENLAAANATTTTRVINRDAIISQDGNFITNLHARLRAQIHELEAHRATIHQHRATIAAQARVIDFQAAQLSAHAAQVQVQRLASQSKTIGRTAMALDLTPNNLFAHELYDKEPILGHAETGPTLARSGSSPADLAIREDDGPGPGVAVSLPET